MKPFARIAACTALLFILIGGPVGTGTAAAQDGSSGARIPEGVYLELTEEFYEALRREPGRQSTVYSNDPSADRLREIAVSARFMVQTNLEILKQQEEMIQLLRRLLETQ